MEDMEEEEDIGDDEKIIIGIEVLISKKELQERRDETFQEEIIKLLEKITDVERADEESGNYDKKNIETGLLSTLVQNNMVDVIKYIVNREDVSTSYVSKGFIWASRRVEQGAIFAILDSGKVNMHGLLKGLKELKTERSDKEFIKELAEAISSKISKTHIKEKEGKKLKLKLTANDTIELKSTATDTIMTENVIIGDYINETIKSPSDTIIIIKVLDRLHDEKNTQYFVYTLAAYNYFTKPSDGSLDIRTAPAVVFPCVKANGLYLYTARGSLLSAPKKNLDNMQLDKPLLSLDVLFKLPGHINLGDINNIISKQVANKYNVIGILVSRETNNNVPAIAKYPFDTGVGSLHCNPGGESVQIWRVHEISNIDEINRQVKKSIEKEGGQLTFGGKPYKKKHERKIDKTRKKIKTLSNAGTFRVKKSSSSTHKRRIRVKKTSKKVKKGKK